MFSNKDAELLSFDRPPDPAPMPAIQLFEDEACIGLHPLNLIEGTSGIRAGAFTQEERWIRLAQLARQSGHDGAGDLRINARWIPDGNAIGLLSELGPGMVLRQDGTLLASRGDGGGTEMEPSPDRKQFLLGHANQLFSHLEAWIMADFEQAAADWACPSWTEDHPTAVYGPMSRLKIASDATFRAASVNTEHGPVLIAPGATVEPGVHLEGPLIVCHHAVVRMGARVSGPSVIGPHCKVGGEIKNVNFQGWSNKAHDGYLGNSVIGRWCNLGAGTVSSNLKNTYGEVRQWSAETQRLEPTGLTFCGLLMGDHVKCGIGTTFNTGTVIDPACVIFDAGFPPKHLPPFSWYDARKAEGRIQDLERMLITAERTMARRGMSLAKAHRERLTQLHALRQSEG